MTNEKVIAALPGDGIGPEIMDAALKILRQLDQKYDLHFKIAPFPFGAAGIKESGTPLPDKTLTACAQADAILLAAIGDPAYEHAAETPEAGLLKLRKSLELFANIRPIKVSPVIAPRSPIKPEVIAGTDFVIVRELTGGLYFGKPRELTETSALDTCVYSKAEIERILHVAFQMAQKRKKIVTSVDKANVLATSKLWRKTAEEVAAQYPDVTLHHQLVDSCAMMLIKNPSEFDVVVTENLFGDILSDEASVIPGSLGMMPSASLSAGGPALYEPIHGSAPDIAGKNLANPISMLLSMTMMLRDTFQLTEIAKRVEDAIDRLLDEGIMTKDLGGEETTTSFAEKLSKTLEEE
ncbi:3-isopropylmalate dehydrogenase [Enterococcus hirae]|nr:3-isopropylmalate dehydrogenase [Enterococcus hirae]